MLKDQVENKAEELNNHEVLVEFYRLILQTYPHKKIKIEQPILSEIADDSDHHSFGSNRKGYLLFEDACLVDIGEKRAVVALAIRRKGYASGAYTGEIKLFEPDPDMPQTDEFIREQISDKDYFVDALLVGAANGRIALGGFTRRNLVAPAFGDEIEGDVYKEYIAGRFQKDHGHVSFGASDPAVKRPQTYKPGLPEIFLKELNRVGSQVSES